MSNFLEYMIEMISKKNIEYNTDHALERICRALENIPPRDSETLQKWIHALRSGLFTQCRSKLGCITDNGQENCATGVYAEIAGYSKSVDRIRIYYDGEAYAIYDEFLTNDFVDFAMTLNDTFMFSFEEIAYVLETYIPVESLSEGDARNGD